MVRIIDFKVRMNSEGEPFVALIVQGGIKMVKSKESGMFYATAKKASIPSTFDEETCKSLVGQELDGIVQKVECESYEFTNEQTGEVMELNHRWVYVKETETAITAVKMEDFVGQPELV